MAGKISDPLGQIRREDENALDPSGVKCGLGVKWRLGLKEI